MLQTEASKYFVVDVEASGRTPISGVMTDFGVAHLGSDATFYGHIFDYHMMSPTKPLPVVEVDRQGNPSKTVFCEVDGVFYANILPDESALVESLRQWMIQVSGSERGVLVSDNPAFDAMWMNCFLDAHGGEMLFGFSARHIGDFYAGQQRSWKRHSDWKKLRRHPHSHHPLDDAIGNRNALRTILDIR